MCSSWWYICPLCGASYRTERKAYAWGTSSFMTATEVLFVLVPSAVVVSARTFARTSARWLIALLVSAACRPSGCDYASFFWRRTSWAGQEANNLSIGSYSAVFTSLGLKLGGSSHKAIGKPPTPEKFPSESIWLKYWQNMANWRRSRGQSHCKIDWSKGSRIKL